MITWSGKAVQLAPRFDIEYTPNSFSWSASPDTGVEFSSTNVETPTVTITKTTNNPSVVTLTLTVDDGNGPIQDSITVDVYDTACKATIAAGKKANNPTDIDGNCVTNLVDFAELVLTWLEDRALTAAEPK